MVLTIGCLAALGNERASQLFRLRHRVFRERLSWNVPSCEGEERDEFDTEHATYILSAANNGTVAGCIRLISTECSYMIEKVFPELLDGAPAPHAADTWEMSRFAFESEGGAEGGWGFSGQVLALIRGAVDFAKQRDITRYLLVTTIGIERLMLHQGLHCYRIGTPKRIGGVMSVALALHVDDVTEQALAATRSETQRPRRAEHSRPQIEHHRPGISLAPLALRTVGVPAFSAAAC